jgi:hypothetical protein
VKEIIPALALMHHQHTISQVARAPLIALLIPAKREVENGVGSPAGMNPPPPKGGGFRLRLKAGSIGPRGRLAYTTVK